MKLTKISLAIIASAGLLSLAPSINAQTSTNTPATNAPAPRRAAGRMSVDDQLKTLTERLKLTDEQKPKVKAVLEEQNKSRLAGRDLTPEERRAKAKTLHDETMKKMKEILTADQFKKYEETQPGRRPAAGAAADKQKTAE